MQNISHANLHIRGSLNIVHFVMQNTIGIKCKHIKDAPMHANAWQLTYVIYRNAHADVCNGRGRC